MRPRCRLPDHRNTSYTAKHLEKPSVLQVTAPGSSPRAKRFLEQVRAAFDLTASYLPRAGLQLLPDPPCPFLVAADRPESVLIRISIQPQAEPCAQPCPGSSRVGPALGLQREPETACSSHQRRYSGLGYRLASIRWCRWPRGRSTARVGSVLQPRRVHQRAKRLRLQQRRSLLTPGRLPRPAPQAHPSVAV